MLQNPDFGLGPDGLAMNNRVTKFEALSLPTVVRGVGETYKRDAMEIIHWIAYQLKDMDLFENVLNGNPKYVKMPRDVPVLDELDLPRRVNMRKEMGRVDATILPLGNYVI